MVAWKPSDSKRDRRVNSALRDGVQVSARAHAPMDWGESMYGLHLEKWARSVASMTS